MPRQTTAIILVGSRESGPWGEPLLRPTHLLRFTENSVPGWQVHPLLGAHGLEAEPTTAGTTAALNGSPSLGHELVVLIATLIVRDAATINRSDILPTLRTDDSGGGISIPDMGFSADAVRQAATVVSESCHLWLIPLEGNSLLLQDGTLEQLRQWNIDVELLASQSAASKAVVR